MTTEQKMIIEDVIAYFDQDFSSSRAWEFNEWKKRVIVGALKELLDEDNE